MNESPENIRDRRVRILPENALKLFGFCRRSGKLVCGAGQVIASLTGKRPPCAVVIASDASERTRKQLAGKCSYRGVMLAETAATGEKLAHILGKTGVVMAAGAADPTIGKEIIRLTDEYEGKSNKQ